MFAEKTKYRDFIRISHKKTSPPEGRRSLKKSLQKAESFGGGYCRPCREMVGTAFESPRPILFFKSLNHVSDLLTTLLKIAVLETIGV